MIRKSVVGGVVACCFLFSNFSTVSAQQTVNEGAVKGGIAGAILGGIAGHQNNETPEGIAIGGIAGALAGGFLGKANEQDRMRQYQYQQAQAAQRQYEINQAVSMNDAITMSRSGLSANLIVSQIRKNGVQQEVGVREVIELHNNGVPEVVIQEMQKARIAGTSRPVVQQRPAVIVERPAPVFIEPVPVFHHGPYYHRGPHHARGHLHFHVR